MPQNLKGKRVAILVANGFEENEFEKPKKALEEAGAITVVVSPAKGKIKGWKDKNWSKEIAVEMDISQAKGDEFDALLLPGGVISPDFLRADKASVEFVKQFVKANKPIGAICHGPWTLINAEGVKGKTVTSWASLEKDLTNAGAKWVDKEVSVDGNIVTSRKPEDIPAFNQALIELISLH